MIEYLAKFALVTVIFSAIGALVVYFVYIVDKKTSEDNNKIFKGAIVKYHGQETGIVEAWNDDGVYLRKFSDEISRKRVTKYRQLYFVKYDQIDKWG